MVWLTHPSLVFPQLSDIFILGAVVRYIGCFWSWRWMAFFFLFGPLLIVEKSVKDYFGGWLNLSKQRKDEQGFNFAIVSRRVLGIIYSMGTAFFIAHYLFVPPVYRLGIQTESNRLWSVLGMWVWDGFTGSYQSNLFLVINVDSVRVSNRVKFTEVNNPYQPCNLFQRVAWGRVGYIMFRW